MKPSCRNAAADRAALEQQMRLLEHRLEAADKLAMLGAMLPSLAHELNNPVNCIHIGAEAMRDDIERFRLLLHALAGEDAAPEVLAALDARCDALATQTGTLIAGSLRVRNLLRDMRVLSKATDEPTEQVDLTEALLSTVALVRNQYGHTIAMHCELPPLPEIPCRPARLNQVFMNLVVNACQAVDARQQSEPALAGTLHVRAKVHDDALVLLFEDNGCGMDETVLAHAGTPYHTTRASEGGTGLGLSICAQIVAQHHGRLQFTSTVGQGTCVEVRLPRG